MTDLYEITSDLSEPFYDGTQVGRSSATSLPIGIDGRGFLVDLGPTVPEGVRYQRSPVNVLNTQQAQSSGDQAQVPPEVWRRIVESWVKGSGQSNTDRSDSQPERFHDSRNIDPFDPWRLSLINRTEELIPMGIGRSHLVRVNEDTLWAAVAGSSWWITDLAGIPTAVALTDDVVDATSDGQTLYVLDTTGNIEAWTDSATHSSFATATGTANLLRYVKGFLLLGDGPKLQDVSSGTPVDIFTHELTAWRWVDATEGDKAAYVVGGIGDRWHVGSMAIKSDATTLDVPILNSGKIPDGEIAYSVGSYLGYVMVGLSTGWRFGVPDGNGDIQFGRLIDTSGPVRCFEGQDRFVWYGTTDLDDTGLGRADLATFSGPVTPAVASDLRSGVPGTVRAVTTFQGKRVFTVDGQGLYAETDEKAASGWLSQGTMNFGTSDRKNGLYAQVYLEPLHGRVLVEASYDGGDFVTLANVGSAGSVSLGKIPIERSFDTIELRYTLTPDDLLEEGPVVTRAEVRATPIAGNATEWRIPLLITSSVNYNNATYGRDVIDDFNLLMGLSQSKRHFTLREGLIQHTVHVHDFVWLPEKPTQDGEFFSGLFVLLLREVA